MASADSKFDDLSDADIDSLVEKAVPKMTKKATACELKIFHSSKLRCFCVGVINSFASFRQSVKSSLFFFYLSVI